MAKPNSQIPTADSLREIAAEANAPHVAHCLEHVAAHLQTAAEAGWLETSFALFPGTVVTVPYPVPVAEEVCRLLRLRGFSAKVERAEIIISWEQESKTEA